MKAAKCHTCGKAEWNHICAGPPVRRRGKQEFPEKGTKAALKSEEGQIAAVPIDVVEVQPAGKRKRAPRGSFDRTAYQREWMRNRRRRQKE